MLSHFFSCSWTEFDFVDGVDRPVPLWGLEAIWRDDRVVGFLRRAEYGFTLKKSLGYGYVSRPDGLPVTKVNFHRLF